MKQVMKMKKIIIVEDDERLREELLQDDRIFTLLLRSGIVVNELGCAQQSALGSIEFYYE